MFLLFDFSCSIGTNFRAIIYRANKFCCNIVLRRCVIIGLLYYPNVSPIEYYDVMIVFRFSNILQKRNIVKIRERVNEQEFKD